MIKLIITSIIIFIIIILVLLTLNVRIEYFNNDMFISKNYPILRDNNNNIINPTAWYKFDNTNLGLNSVNSSFNANVVGTIISNNSIFIKGSQSVYFQKSNNSYLSIPNAINIDNKSFSISLWVYPLSMGSRFRLFYSGSNPGIINGTLHIGYRGTSSVTFDFAGNGLDASQNNNNDLNKWNFYAFTFDNSTNPKQRKIYKNGILIANGTSPVALNNSGIRYEIGGRYAGANNDTFDGYMNDFRIYSEIVLTDDQVNELYLGYKKVGELIDTSVNCSAIIASSGAITQIPNPNMRITDISAITKLYDNLYNQSFGNGNITYTMTFSKYLNDDYIPTNLLLRNNKPTAFVIDNYNDLGNYVGVYNNTNINYGIRNYTEKGEFIHIRLPSPIVLKRYGFRADEYWISRAPGTWALYTGTRLLEPSRSNPILLVNNTTRLNNNSYCNANSFTYYHDISSNTTSANELLFIFPSLANSTNGNNPGYVLSFMELILFSG